MNQMKIAHKKGILSKDKWIYNDRTGDGLEIYEHIEKGWINLFNPRTGDFLDD